jgi:hypothetical protein
MSVQPGCPTGMRPAEEVTMLRCRLEEMGYFDWLRPNQKTISSCFFSSAQKSLEKVPPQIRRIIAAPAFLNALCDLFQKAA